MMEGRIEFPCGKVILYHESINELCPDHGIRCGASIAYLVDIDSPMEPCFIPGFPQDIQRALGEITEEEYRQQFIEEENG